MRRGFFLLLLVLTLVRGIVYASVFPPWQHHDEPTHFEYASLIAKRRALLQSGDYDLNLRREIAASMKAMDFWKELGDPPVDLWSDQPPVIGYAELDHPPAYYVLVAVPLLLVANQEVETQLFVGRMVSVLLYVLVVATAYGVVKDAFPSRYWLPLVVAAFIGLMPTMADLMSSVNSDVGAITLVSLLLWSAVRLLRYGASLRRLATTLFLAGLCIITKSTASTMAVVILLTLGVALVPGRFRRWLLIGLAPLIVAILAASFTWGGNAAYWYNLRPPLAQNRIVTPAPLGEAVFVVAGGKEPYSSYLLQELEESEGQRLQGKIVTMGAWVKAAEDTAAPVLLSLLADDSRTNHRVKATSDWTFHAFTATIELEATGVASLVMAPIDEADPHAVHVDGIVLVEGEMPAELSPQFETPEAEQGQWGSEEFKNLLRNASAEAVWPGMRGWIGDKQLYRQPIVHVFHSMLDWHRTKWVYRPDLAILHDSFWGRFGWSHIALPPALFVPLWLVTIGAVVGTGLAIVRRIRSNGDIAPWQRWAWIMMGVVGLSAWGVAYLRIHPVFLTFNIYWSMARYAAVAILPTATALCLGLAELSPCRWKGWLALLGLLGMLTLDAIALLIVFIPYYYG